MIIAFQGGFTLDALIDASLEILDQTFWGVWLLFFLASTWPHFKALLGAVLAECRSAIWHYVGYCSATDTRWAGGVTRRGNNLEQEDG